MKTKDSHDIMATLQSKNRVGKILVAALVLLLFLQTIYMLTTGKQHTITYIPMGITDTVSVGQSEASEEYLLAMGNYAAYLMLNFDSNTVVKQYDKLAMLSSKAVRADSIKLAEDYKKSGISSRIIVQSVEATDQYVTVKGRRQKYILDKLQEDKTFTLSIKYSIRYGTFRISELELK